MDSADAQILFGLGRLATVLRMGQWNAAAKAGLNPAQAEILRWIASRPMRQAEIAAHLGVSAASVSDSISALVAKGLANRQHDPADRRAQRVVPTRTGLALAANLPGGPEPLRTVLAGLPEAERAGLLRTLVRLIRGLQEARAIPSQRMCVTCRHFRPHVHDDPSRPHHCQFVNAAFGDASLRLDCGDHEEAPAEDAAARWRRLEAA
jgi:DNA-binding MarR family transcriptional regulator